MLTLADIKGFELAYRRGKMSTKQMKGVGCFRMDIRAKTYYDKIMGDILCSQL